MYSSGFYDWELPKWTLSNAIMKWLCLPDNKIYKTFGYIILGLWFVKWQLVCNLVILERILFIYSFIHWFIVNFLSLFVYSMLMVILPMPC